MNANQRTSLLLALAIVVLSIGCGGLGETNEIDANVTPTSDISAEVQTDMPGELVTEGPKDVEGHDALQPDWQQDDGYTPWWDVAATGCYPPCEQGDCPSCCDCPPTYCHKGEQQAPCIGTPQENEVCVPGGPFVMGSDHSYQESPPHPVWLSPYFIEKTEVTNEQYRGCVASGKCTPPEAGSDFYDLTKANHPAIVDIKMAAAYCGWRSKRLPSEAEWEKAARGTDSRKYPWGNQVPDCTLANSYSCNGGKLVSVGSYPSGVSPYGVFDMAGNAIEFVDEGYREWAYRFKLDACYPHWPCPDTGNVRANPYRSCVLRGGGITKDKSDTRVTQRYSWSSGALAGFRCVRSAE